MSLKGRPTRHDKMPHSFCHFSDRDLSNFECISVLCTYAVEPCCVYNAKKPALDVAQYSSTPPSMAAGMVGYRRSDCHCVSLRVQRGDVGGQFRGGEPAGLQSSTLQPTYARPLSFPMRSPYVRTFTVHSTVTWQMPRRGTQSLGILYGTTVTARVPL